MLPLFHRVLPVQRVGRTLHSGSRQDFVRSNGSSGAEVIKRCGKGAQKTRPLQPGRVLDQLPIGALRIALRFARRDWTRALIDVVVVLTALLRRILVAAAPFSSFSRRTLPTSLAGSALALLILSLLALLVLIPMSARALTFLASILLSHVPLLVGKNN